MTSEERHAARRQRREQKRRAKRLAAIAPYDNYLNVINCNSLMGAALLSRKGVSWKASVQKYMMNLLRNTVDLHNKLLAEKSVV